MVATRDATGPDLGDQAPPMTPQGAFEAHMTRFRYTDETPSARRSFRLADSSKVDPNRSTPVPLPSPLKRVRSPSPDTPGNNRKLTPAKKRGSSGGYAAPSRYAHLSPLVDILQTGLTLVFVGVNPGISTAVAGHSYAHPSNRFWSLLHSSGLTPERKLSPREDRDLPQLYKFGNTNIVERPTKDQSQLSKEEMVAGAGVLEEKFRRFRPEAVCIVGKGIWEAIWKYKYGKAIKKEEFHYGWQNAEHNMGREAGGFESKDETFWQGSHVFVATSTSGQAASMKPAEREAIWKILGDWAQTKRAESIA